MSADLICGWVLIGVSALTVAAVCAYRAWVAATVAIDAAISGAVTDFDAHVDQALAVADQDAARVADEAEAWLRDWS